MSEITVDVGGIKDRVFECPECESTYLHQDGVEVFVRDAEDSDEGLHIDVDYSEGATVNRSMESNVSSRRDSIRVSFECEQCNRDPTLRIEQHKGQEFVSWE